MTVWTEDGIIWIKRIFRHGDEIAGAGKYADEAIDVIEGAVKHGDEIIEGAGKYVDDALDIPDALRVIDGKVGGKIPVDEYDALRVRSVTNAGSDTLTLGKYTGDASSYTVRAGDTMFFDMGEEWGRLKRQYGLSDDELFEFFNIPVLDEAIFNGKTIRFSHDPRLDRRSLGKEWEYIKLVLGLTDDDLILKGDFWYVK